MKHASTKAETPQNTVRIAEPDMSAGATGIAIAPPAYGINIVDKQPFQAVSEPSQMYQTLESAAWPAPSAMVQRQVATPGAGNAATGIQEKNNTGLPDTLKAGIEALSGLTMEGVKVYYNSSRPAQLQALAFTQGAAIYVGPGQERHLPHEAWHVVQQKQGRVRPTMQAQGFAINEEPGLEKEAEVMGARASQAGLGNLPKTRTVGDAGLMAIRKKRSQAAMCVSHDRPLNDTAAEIGVMQFTLAETVATVAKALGIGATITAIAAYFGLPYAVVYGLLATGLAAGAIISQLKGKQAETSGAGPKKKRKKKGRKKSGKEQALKKDEGGGKGDEDSEDSGDDEDVDEAVSDDEFATRLTALSKSKTKTSAPSHSISVAMASPPTTPAQEWRNKQSEWGNACDNVIPQLNSASRVPSTYGDHDVNQAAVTRLLPAIGPGNRWLQGRPEHSGSDVRVFVECTAARVPEIGGQVVIAKGISHDANRRSGSYWIYRRTGGRSFTHSGGNRHEKDIT